MEKIFKIKPNNDLIKEVALSQLFSRRKKIAHTKERDEKRGGGRKPWRQKGTGRARHGSIRSPLWKGGGVTFGPRAERNFKKKINLKTKRKALLMTLSAKKKDIKLVDEIKAEKTKEVVELLKKNNLERSVLIVLKGYDIKTIRSIRNIDKVDVMQAKDLNVLDLLQYQHILMEKGAAEIIEKLL